MNRIQRFRLALARILLAGSGHEVVKTDHLEKAQSDVWKLNSYVRSAGGFSSPHRIKAQRKTQRALEQIDTFIRGCRQLEQ